MHLDELNNEPQNGMYIVKPNKKRKLILLNEINDIKWAGHSNLKVGK